MDDINHDRARFASMMEGDAEDWRRISGEFAPFARDLPDRVLTHLRLLGGDFGGFPVDRLQHSLQCATRAYRDGRAEDYVVMALIHDIGDTLGSYNHPDIAAAILKPFLSDELHWITQQHGVFQGYYYFHYLGFDRDIREQHRGHRHFEATAEFCEKYDQCAFDAAYDSAPLEFFEPMLRRVMAQPIRSMFLS